MPYNSALTFGSVKLFFPGLSQFPTSEAHLKNCVDENADNSIGDKSNSTQSKRRKLFDSSQPAAVVTQDIHTNVRFVGEELPPNDDDDDDDDFVMSRSPSKSRKRVRRISSSDDDDDIVVKSTQELEEELRLLEVT